MNNNKKDVAYIMAKHRAEKLKRFYVHGIVFIVVNGFLLLFKVIRNMNNGETFVDALLDWSAATTPLIWGIVLGIHAFSVFGPNIILGRDWEEAKLKQFMKEEERKNNKL
ncbi:MAG: 2TM domain-containing protein [Flavobacteriaceae bacterium]|nr:2TM domain-containing protein [Flavobacteriaceae bacterium]RZV57977.1 MAG: 2TM domain-containing protein [Flavobacteriaceae bacterium]